MISAARQANREAPLSQTTWTLTVTSLSHMRHSSGKCPGCVDLGLPAPAAGALPSSAITHNIDMQMWKLRLGSSFDRLPQRGLIPRSAPAPSAYEAFLHPANSIRLCPWRAQASSQSQ